MADLAGGVRESEPIRLGMEIFKMRELWWKSVRHINEIFAD